MRRIENIHPRARRFRNLSASQTPHLLSKLNSARGSCQQQTAGVGCHVWNKAQLSPASPAVTGGLIAPARLQPAPAQLPLQLLQLCWVELAQGEALAIETERRGAGEAMRSVLVLRKALL